MAEDVLKTLKDAVLNYDVEAAVEASNEVIKTGFDPLKAIEEGLGEGLKIIGEKFAAGEIFLPMLMIAAQAMKESLAVLEPALAKGISRKVLGKVVVGTVEGDIHDIGCDAPTSKFIEKVKEVNPDIIGMSALLTTTMPKMTEVIDALKKEGFREKVKVIVGGAPVSAAWAEQIGADSYGEDAMAAVDVAKKLVGK
jgi:5-methyltetrahydrofolate--homocysteine methyltransferase